MSGFDVVGCEPEEIYITPRLTVGELKVLLAKCKDTDFVTLVSDVSSICVQQVSIYKDFIDFAGLPTRQ